MNEFEIGDKVYDEELDMDGIVVETAGLSVVVVEYENSTEDVVHTELLVRR